MRGEDWVPKELREFGAKMKEAFHEADRREKQKVKDFKPPPDAEVLGGKVQTYFDGPGSHPSFFHTLEEVLDEKGLKEPINRLVDFLRRD